MAVIIVVLLASGVVKAATRTSTADTKVAAGHSRSSNKTNPQATTTTVTPTTTTTPTVPTLPKSAPFTPVSPLTVKPVTTVPVAAQPLNLSPATIANRVDPAVVDVDTRLSYQNAIAAGTGMVLSSDGVILTNNHVVVGATTIAAVSIADGRDYAARVIGVDPSADVAVLQLIGASDLPTVPIATSSASSGAGVVAIGNAGGTGGAPSVTAGTVLATDQSIVANDPAEGTSERLEGLLATSASLQPGDSGGPLINGAGQVIGMDTAASEASGSTPTVSFAIPIAQALDIAHQIESGLATDGIYLGLPPFLGVQVTNGTIGHQTGAQVIAVVPGGPAAAAGIVSRDLIVTLNGEDIDSPATLSTVLRRFVPGSSVSVTWLDAGGISRSAEVTLGTGPAD